MKAFLIINRLQPEIYGNRKDIERRLPPLVDRPFLQHAVETIIEANSGEVDLALVGAPKKVHDVLGDGSQWGVSLDYHDVPAGTHPYDVILAQAESYGDDPILLAHSDVLPQLNQHRLADPTTPMFFCWKDRATHWTGWALLRGQDFVRLRVGASEVVQQHGVGSRMPAGFNHEAIEESPRPLLMCLYTDLIDAHIRVLQNQHPGLLLTGREVTPGVRIARNVVIHRTVKLFPPVFIGENSRIGEHCRVGPGAFIGRDCLIQNRTLIENSIICPGSYVGEGLDLRQVYIDRGRLVNARLEAEVDPVDGLLLGSVYGSKGNFVRTAIAWTK